MFAEVSGWIALVLSPLAELQKEQERAKLSAVARAAQRKRMNMVEAKRRRADSRRRMAVFAAVTRAF